MLERLLKWHVFFEESHPRESWPEWLEKYIRFRATKNEKNWIVRLVLMHKVQLEPNQYWEWTDGRDIPSLISVDPTTGEKRVIISGGPPTDVDVLFEVEIDFINLQYKVTVDMDISTLDRTKYEIV